MKNEFLKWMWAIGLSVALAGNSFAAGADGKSQQDRINNAAPSEIGALIRKDSKNRDIEAGPSPFVIRLQIALDRAGYSVGVIDGYNGNNVGKAVAAFQHSAGLEPSGNLNEATWENLKQHADGVVQEYVLTQDDIDGPFVDVMPDDYAELAEMPELGYISVQEMLAERFHMDVDLLEYLNEDVDFAQAGSTILVADTGADIADRKVSRIEVDGKAGILRAMDESGKIVAVYPATVGSRDNPSPSGSHTVKAIAPDPTYSYRPDVNFVQGDNTEPLTLPPGPNGPVGSMWIDLSTPTYGIHGTPEPSLIDKANSHGCVRLTNWDAKELAGLVSPGTVVEFSDTGGENKAVDR